MNEKPGIKSPFDLLRVLRFALLCTFFLTESATHSLAETWDAALSPLMGFNEVTLSKKITKVSIDLSSIKDQLQDIGGERSETVFLCFFGGRTSLKKTPSWQVYFSKEPDIQLTRTNAVQKNSGICATNPNYLGELKFYSPGAWSKKTVHTMMAVRKTSLESILENDGKGFLTFVLNDDRDEAKLAEKPAVLTDLTLQLQKAWTVR